MFLLLLLIRRVSAASNVVYIVTDDQDQMLGSSFPDYGSTPMPKTKKLFSDGITFTNFFIHVPICNPSRSTTLTGRYFHNLKATNTTWAAMHVDMNLVHNSTFAVGFKEAGYSTGLFGKYANAMPSYKPKGWDVFMANDGGSYFHPKFARDDHWAKGGDNYTTSVVGNATVDWVKSVQAPFFAYVAPKAAHEPFNPAPWYASFWDPSWPVVERKGEAWNSSYLKRRDHGGNVPSQPQLTEYSSQVISGIWQNRWRTLMSVDDLVEGIFEACPSEDTYFFFTSDHGFQLGQFNMLMDKRHVYDWNTRVHLLVRGPGIVAKTDRRLFTNVDLAPTFAEIAGFRDALYDGSSLFSSTERQSIFVEYYYNDPNVKCVGNCSTDYSYPSSDSSCANLEENTLCWGKGCNEECYPTEDERNNFIGLRLINDTHNLLYAKYETGYQARKNIDFRGGASDRRTLFYELFDANEDPWMMNNLYDTTPNATLAHLDAQLMAWYDCSSSACFFT